MEGIPISEESSDGRGGGFEALTFVMKQQTLAMPGVGGGETLQPLSKQTLLLHIAPSFRDRLYVMPVLL